MSKRMAAPDVAWLRMEQPSNPMTITGVMMTGAPMSRETLLQLLEERFITHRRFRMSVDDPKGAAPRWLLQDPFALERHVIPLALEPPGDQKALEEAVSRLMSAPLSFSAPPWTFHHVEHYTGGGRDGSALIIRLHHCIADGIALVHVLLSLADEHGENHRPQPPSTKRSLARRIGRTARRAASETKDLLLHPTHLAARAVQIGGGTRALVDLLAMRPDSETFFKGEASALKRAAWSPRIPLDRIKAISKASATKINDVLLAAVAGALRRTLLDHGQPANGVTMRAAVPFNVRDLDKAPELGNAFALVFLNLPVGEEDAGKRLRLVKGQMDAIKDSKEPAVVYGILQTIGRAPKRLHRFVVRLFSEKCSAVVTNVPGPSETFHLMGVPLDSLMFWVPQAGDIGLGLSLLSYGGGVYVGVALDAHIVADPQSVVQRIEREFEVLAQATHRRDRSRR